VKDRTPSATAIVVAKNIALVAATPRLSFLVDPAAASLTGLFIQEYDRGGSTFLRRAQQPWFRFLFSLYERCTIPGLALHQALRKRHIERIVRNSLLEGIEQVVVLGGGLDTLALRLHQEFPSAKFLELDHPATQQLKVKMIESRNLAQSNLKLFPVDFSKHSLQDVLSTSPEYSPQENTLFLCEGVLMYLTPTEIESLFGLIRRQEGPKVRFVFTNMELDKHGRPAFRNSTWLVRLWLQLQKEPFTWGLTTNEIRTFLEARSFLLTELVDSKKYRHEDLHGLGHEVIAEGEILCVADRR